MQFRGDGTISDLCQDPVARELPEEDIFSKPNLDNLGEAQRSGFGKGRRVMLTLREGPHCRGAQQAHRPAWRHRYKSFLVQPLVLPHPALERRHELPHCTDHHYTDLHGTNRADRAMLRFSISPGRLSTTPASAAQWPHRYGDRSARPGRYRRIEQKAAGYSL